MSNHLSDIYTVVETLINADKKQETLEYLTKIFTDITTKETPYDLAVFHIRLMMLYENKNDIESSITEITLAIRELEQSMVLTEEYQFLLAQATMKYGDLLNQKKLYQESILAYTSACNIIQSLLKIDPFNEKYLFLSISIESEMAIPLSLRGDFDDGILHFQNALQMRRSLLERNSSDEEQQSLIANLYYNIGENFLRAGKFPLSLQNYHDSLNLRLAIFQQNPDNYYYLKNVLESIIGITAVYRETGDFGAAKNECIQYENLFNALEDESDFRIIYYKAMFYGNLGIISKDQDFFEKSEYYYSKSLSSYVELQKIKPDDEAIKRSYATLCNNYGICLAEGGQHNKAYNQYKTALDIRNEFKDKYPEDLQIRIEVASTTTNLGNLCLYTHKLNDSETWHKDAVQLWQSIICKDPSNTLHLSSLAASKNNLGNVLRNRCAQDAEQEYQEALHIRQKLCDAYPKNLIYSRHLASSYFNIGAIFLDRDDYQCAISYFDQALSYASKCSHSYDSVKIYDHIGLCYQKKGDGIKAEEMYKKAIDYIEKIRHDFDKEENKINIFWDKMQVYDHIISLLVAKKEYSRAWEYVQKSKARTLLDLLRFTSITPPETISDDQKKSEHEILNKLKEYDLQIRRVTDINEYSSLIQNKKRLEASLDQLYEKIADVSPDYVDFRRGSPLQFDGIKSTLKNLEGTKKIVEFYVTESAVYLFILKTNDSHPIVKELPINSHTIIDSVEQYDREIRNYYNFPGMTETWFNSIIELIKPIVEEGDTCDVVYFVPHKYLHYLPLHAIPIDGKRLIEYIPIAYTQSLSKLKNSVGIVTVPKNCISIGYLQNGNKNNDFEIEARNVAGQYASKAHVGKNATSSLLTHAIADVIHLSCHGIFKAKDPLLSGLQLYDLFVSADMIYDMNISTGLIVLSACETGLNTYATGDDLIGLTRSFLYAGCRSLVVSLWRVNGSSTREFMEKFHQLIILEGIDDYHIEKALQKIQIEMIHSSSYYHPYYWAPFIVVR